MEWYFLSTTLDPANLTPSIKILPNETHGDSLRESDFLISGGSLPSHRPAVVEGKFLKEAYPKTRTVLVTCIGSQRLASSGVVDSMKAITNGGGLYPWQNRCTLPWNGWTRGESTFSDNCICKSLSYFMKEVVEGKLWASGGAQAVGAINHYSCCYRKKG